MLEHKAVRSSAEISKRIADYLELCDPPKYPPRKRCKTIRLVNDVLQGRSFQSVEEMIVKLEAKSRPELDGKLDEIRNDISSFLRQKALLERPYINISTNGKDYRYAIYDAEGEHPLKVVDQKLYDRAAEHGFPDGFFQHSYFDHVTFYCLPAGVKFYQSLLQGCRFSVCSLERVSFDWAKLYDTTFHSCRIYETSFFLASLANVRFEDSALLYVSFRQAHMKACSTLYCSLDQIKFTDAVLDGCSYGRVSVKYVWDLDSATITQGGATQEECQRFKYSTLQVLSGKAPDHLLPVMTGGLE